VSPHRKAARGHSGQAVDNAAIDYTVGVSPTEKPLGDTPGKPFDNAAIDYTVGVSPHRKAARVAKLSRLPSL
jgi:hypothetical protein